MKALALFGLIGSLATAQAEEAQSKTTSAPATAEEVTSSPLIQELQTAMLVQKKDGAFKEDAQVSSEDKYYAFYFSAHWCPPCREFSPILAKFYKDNYGKAKQPFDIVFVSSDKNDQAMKAYVDEAGMGFKVAPYKSELGEKLKASYATRYLPTLTIVDNKGNVVSKPYGDDNKNIYDVLEELKKLINE